MKKIEFYIIKAQFREACSAAYFDSKQVEDRKYDQELLENGVDKILKYKIACYKKQCKVKLADA